MGKWLGIAAALLLLLLIFLWHSMNESAPEARTQTKDEPPQVAMVTPPLKADPKIPVATDVTDETPAGKPEKLDPMSDEFFYKFTERVPKKLTADASECYEGKAGSLHRNQKLTLAFNVVVKNGNVTVRDVKIKPADPDEPNQLQNTLADPALESCFIQKVARSGWRDDSLPDYEWPDELVLRPERGMRGYQKWNRDYVGAEAPKRDPNAHLALKPDPVKE